MAAQIRILVLVGFAGIASGLLSFVTEGVPRLSEDAQAVLGVVWINPHVLLPGVWFGLLTGSMAWRWGTRGILGAVISLVATWIAWQGAVQTGAMVFDRLGPWTSEDSLRLLAAGAAAGAAGSLGTVLGIAASVPLPRLTLIVTVAVGTMFGLQLAWSMTPDGIGVLLYSTWQSAVALVLCAFILRHRAATVAQREVRQHEASAGRGSAERRGEHQSPFGPQIVETAFQTQR